MNLQQLHKKLQYLESQKSQLENEILQTKKQIEQLSPFTKEQKIELFKSLFIGRSDVFAKYWVSKDGLKKGYSPATYTFKGSDYIPISNEIIQQHLEGKIRLGTYVVVNQTMAKFLVIDLDKASFVEDARAIKIISTTLGLKPLFELSKSGNGIHIWYFFECPIKAKDARKLGDIIITKAMDSGSGIDMTSYDRMFLGRIGREGQECIAVDFFDENSPMLRSSFHKRQRGYKKMGYILIDEKGLFK